MDGQDGRDEALTLAKLAEDAERGAQGRKSLE